MGQARNFRSAAAYKKWLAFDKMHVNPKPSKNPVRVSIKGKAHKVKHNPAR